MEAEAELHPQGEGKDGLSFLLKGTRCFVKQGSNRSKGSFFYERGKEPVIQGESPIDARKALRMKDDIKISISNKGRRHLDKNFDDVFEPVSTGILQLQLPPVPVSEGGSWVTPAGLPFKGKLRYIVRSIERGKTAKIEVQMLAEEFLEEEKKPVGIGELTFSFEDGLITSSTITMTHKDKAGRIQTHFRQVMTQKLKP